MTPSLALQQTLVEARFTHRTSPPWPQQSRAPLPLSTATPQRGSYTSSCRVDSEAGSCSCGGRMATVAGEAIVASDTRVHCICMIAFIGARFNGWQQQMGQPGFISAQFALRRAFCAAFSPGIDVDSVAYDKLPVCRASSRLDSSVNADCLLVHTAIPPDAPTELQTSPKYFLLAVNAHLPPSMVLRHVSFRKAGAVGVRRAVQTKTYSYFLRIGPFPCQHLDLVRKCSLFVAPDAKTRALMTKQRSQAAPGDASRPIPTAAAPTSTFACDPSPVDGYTVPPNDGVSFSNVEAVLSVLRSALGQFVGSHDFTRFSTARAKVVAAATSARTAKHAAVATGGARRAAAVAAPAEVDPFADISRRTVRACTVAVCDDPLEPVRRMARIVAQNRAASAMAVAAGIVSAGAPSATPDEDDAGPIVGLTAFMEAEQRVAALVANPCPAAAPNKRGRDTDVADTDARAAAPSAGAERSRLAVASAGAGAARARDSGSGGGAPATLIRVDVVLEGALRYMVRLLVGAAVAQMLGKLPASAIGEALSNPAEVEDDGRVIIARPCTGSGLWLSELDLEDEAAVLGPPSAQLHPDCTVSETLSHGSTTTSHA